MSYLGDLTLRLAAGAMQFEEEFRSRHADFLASGQRSDGGFAGRQGDSDPYYTGFALRGLTLLGALSEDQADRAAEFLRVCLNGDLPAVDFLSVVFSAVLLEVACGIDVFARAGLDRPAEVNRRLAPLRRADGGYAKTPGSGRSSTYQTFLSVSCLQLIGAEVEQPDEILRLVRTRRRDDGGYAEIDAIARGGTNPTAAAVGLVRLLAVDPAADLGGDHREATAAFIAGMQTAEGGLRANSRIPIADLLSTCTGLIALADLDRLDAIDLDQANRYASALEVAGGGFRGGLWDAEVDAEYTFYGLATRALLMTIDR